MIFVFFCSLFHAVVNKFPNIFVHDSYTVRAASDYHLRVGLCRLIRLQEML